ncbi:MAG: cobalt ECF transporter T component CbiQ [Thermodesulfobacteriota bacterium]
MGGIENSLHQIGELDRLAAQDTALHRLDPRAKLAATLGFIVAVVSYGRYEISGLLPLALYPAVLAGMGDIPVRWLLRKLAIASPFALMVGLFNPLLDTAPLLHFDMGGGLEVSGGWVSFASILLRFALTVSAALALVAGTGFNTVCMALGRLGAPRVFVVQLLFLYRYLFVLAEEGLRMVRARNLRSFSGRGQGLKVYGSMLGQLLLRTMDRAQRIHQAMLCRGFDGQIRAARQWRPGPADAAFTLGWLGFFALARSVNLAQLLGRIATGALG